MSLSWPLPKNDPWSTPFAEVLLEHLDIFSGATILDIASGGETFAGIPFTIGLDIVEELKKMIPEGMTLAQMSLRWILDFDAVTVVIPGSKSPLQIPDNASATHLPSLPKSLHDKLSSFYNEEIAQHIRGKY